MPKFTWPQAVAIAAAAPVLHRVIPEVIQFTGFLVERRDERSDQLIAYTTVH